MQALGRSCATVRSSLSSFTVVRAIAVDKLSATPLLLRGRAMDGATFASPFGGADTDTADAAANAAPAPSPSQPPPLEGGALSFL